MADWKNTLYFGDNLDILREHVPDASVDLIYLDPPFNSNATYNVLFREASGEGSAAQIHAFDDTWHWSIESEAAYREVVTDGPKRLADLLQAMRSFLGRNDMMAYLTMMAQRMAELHRVLKPTGSIYLHCDPTASHYLKLLMDAVFGSSQFLNEMTWKRSSAHSDTTQGMRRAGKIRDVLLVYSKTDDYVWNPQYMPYADDYLQAEYRHVAPDGRRYKETDVTAAKPGGDTEYEWHVKRLVHGNARWSADLTDEYRQPQPGWEYKAVTPYRGRYWAYSKANLAGFWNEGRLTHRETGMPRLMQFADDMPGVALQDLWDDIPPVLGNERLGYPTQKPEALLERVIRASSNEGDVVLDPFCGCGTAVAVAERLGRRWMGIDITHLAISLMKSRLHDTFGTQLSEYDVVGVPQDVESARALATESAHDGRYQFEYWALGLVNARPGNSRRRGADAGVDGYVNFFDDDSGKAKTVLVQVKSGHVQRNVIATLKGDMEREKAEMGLLVTLEPPSGPMVQEAAAAGFYVPEHFPNHQFPRVQIATIEELLSGKGPVLPHLGLAAAPTFRRAPRRRAPQGGAMMLL